MELDEWPYTYLQSIPNVDAGSSWSAIGVDPFAAFEELMAGRKRNVPALSKQMALTERLQHYQRKILL